MWNVREDWQSGLTMRETHGSEHLTLVVVHLGERGAHLAQCSPPLALSLFHKVSGDLGLR